MVLGTVTSECLHHFCDISPQTRRWRSIGLILAHRIRCCPQIKTILDQCVVGAVNQQLLMPLNITHPITDSR